MKKKRKIKRRKKKKIVGKQSKKKSILENVLVKFTSVDGLSKFERYTGEFLLRRVVCGYFQRKHVSMVISSDIVPSTTLLSTVVRNYEYCGKQIHDETGERFLDYREVLD